MLFINFGLERKAQGDVWDIGVDAASEGVTLIPYTVAQLQFDR